MNEPIEVPIPLAPDFAPVGYVLERSALWFRRPKGESWHLMRPVPSGLRAWCGRTYTRHDLIRVQHVTWPSLVNLAREAVLDHRPYTGVMVDHQYRCAPCREAVRLRKPLPRHEEDPS